jgi:hypothetical protein
LFHLLNAKLKLLGRAAASLANSRALILPNVGVKGFRQHSGSLNIPVRALWDGMCNHDEVERLVDLADYDCR